MMERRIDTRVAGYILLFIFAHFSHHVLTALVIPMLPFMRNEFSLSYLKVGLLSASFSIAYGVSQLPAGWIADRIGPRYVITAGVAGVAVAGALVGLSGTYLTLVIFLILMGITGGGYHPAAAPLIASSVSPRNRGRALGMHVIGGSSSHFLAPLIGAAIAASMGWRGAFLTLAAPVFVVGILLLVLLRSHRRVEDEEMPAESPAGTDPAAAADPAAADPSATGTSAKPGKRVFTVQVVTVLVLTGVIGTFIQAVVAFVPLLMVDRYGLPEEAAAAFLSLVYSAGFWAAPIGGHLADRFGHVKVLFFLGLLLVPAVIFMPHIPTGIPLVILLLTLGIVMFVRMPASEAFLVGNVPPRMRSTVLGIYFSAGMAGAGVLTPILGQMIDSLGFGATFPIAGAVLAVPVIVCGAILLRDRISLRKQDAGTRTGRAD